MCFCVNICVSVCISGLMYLCVTVYKSVCPCEYLCVLPSLKARSKQVMLQAQSEPRSVRQTQGLKEGLRAGQRRSGRSGRKPARILRKADEPPQPTPLLPRLFQGEAVWQPAGDGTRKVSASVSWRVPDIWNVLWGRVTGWRSS